MSSSKRRRLENTVTILQRQYGPQAVRKGSDLLRPAPPPHVTTGFPALDAVTGCGGIPLGACTLLSGHATSGKLTLAYKILANAQRGERSQRARHGVALIDLTHSSDADYLARCGVDLERLLLVRPTPDVHPIHLAQELVRSRRLRMVLVDNLGDLAAQALAPPAGTGPEQKASQRLPARQLGMELYKLAHLLRDSGCGLLLLDEPSPPWLRWLRLDRSWPARQVAALHIELRRERWLTTAAGELAGYQADAHVLKSRWATGGRRASVDVQFNGTVKARSTW